MSSWATVMRAFTPLLRSPALRAFLSQLLAFGAGLPLCILFSEQNWSLFEWSLLQGVIAAIIGHRLKMACWWIGIHLLFMPSVAATLALNVPPLWFGLVFLILALIYGKTYQTQVPLYLSSEEVTKVLHTVLPQQQPFSFIDLGSGCGGLLKALSHLQSNGRYYGIEAAPLPYLLSQLRKIVGRIPYTIKWGDFWNNDLAHYDVVYAYLSPVPMKRLWEKAKQEMHPGSLLISNHLYHPWCLAGEKHPAQ